MPSMGTGMGMLLLVGAAVLALRWWAQRRQAKKQWLQVGFHGQAPPAFEMGCRCHARRPYWAPPPAQFWMHGEEAGGRFEELPSGPPGPPFPRPPRPSSRGLAPPSPPEVDEDLEGDPALGRR